MNNVRNEPEVRSGAAGAREFGESLWEVRLDIHSYLARRCPDEADDLLVEVWLAAYHNRRTFDPQLGSLRMWLFGIARNRLRMHYSKRSREAGAWRIRRVDHSEDWDAVDARLDAMATAPALRAALKDIPAKDREVLLLVAWEGLSPAEAAEVLGIPQGTARSRLHRAKRRMQDSMRERSGAV